MSNGYGKKGQVSLNTDLFMISLWEHLCRDFRTITSFDCFRQEEKMIKEGIASFRAYDFKRGYLSSPTYFKCRYQLESLFKRYTFKDDPISEKDRAQRTFKKFLDIQQTRSFPDAYPVRTQKVLQRARVICREILGKYSLEEHQQLCRFGKRASVGNRYKDSYQELKLSSLTGSKEHIRWFKDYLHGDSLLVDAIAEVQGIRGPGLYGWTPDVNQLQFVPVTALDYNLAPKSFDWDRGIMPNTTIGGFYSYGLGQVLRKRLKKVRLDVRHLQKKHRKMAQQYSKSRTHATGDLSSASDCYTLALVCRLLPREWFNVLRFGRIDQFCFNEKTYHLTSFMTMGIGFTFELQTLLFYSILKSISDLSGIGGKISVFGDDLVYPSQMHYIVSGVFQDLSFKLNEDKTYVKENFRESCGGDYYCGFDVRPFRPKGQTARYTGVRAASFLYQIANGLLRRWDESQIASTLHHLRTLIRRFQPSILYVPDHYPDTSGWRVTGPPEGYLYSSTRWYLNSNWTVGFQYLSNTSKKRRVKYQAIYYWNQLRPKGDSWDPYALMDDMTALIWKIPKGSPLIAASLLDSSVKLRKMVAFVVKKGQKPRFRLTHGLF